MQSTDIPQNPITKTASSSDTPHDDQLHCVTYLPITQASPDRFYYKVITFDRPGVQLPEATQKRAAAAKQLLLGVWPESCPHSGQNKPEPPAVASTWINLLNEAYTSIGEDHSDVILFHNTGLLLTPIADPSTGTDDHSPRHQPTTRWVPPPGAPWLTEEVIAQKVKRYPGYNWKQVWAPSSVQGHSGVGNTPDLLQPAI
jgi:hypothetical protein